jgi:hypothetical protein
MISQSALKFVAACAISITATASFSQHASPDHASPYAGQQVRDIKALSPSQTADLLAGKGMEQAKAAELNGYPGPMHVLELASMLTLSPTQTEASEALMASHKAEARDLGARLVQAERELDTAFAGQRINAAQVEAQTRHIGLLQAQLRASHLRTHLQQAELLTASQVARYAELRGYAAGPANTSGRTGHSGNNH